MRFKMKALGLAMFAALALSAVAASAAGAAPSEFTASEYPVAITGHQEGSVNYFESTNTRKTECEVATYEGTLEGGSDELTVDATYDKCTASGVPATVHMNSCDFLFTAGEYNAGENDVDGQVHVECVEPNDSITITVGPNVCTIHIPEQTIEGGVTFTNIKGGGSPTPQDYVTVDLEIENEITYVETDTPSPLFCPFSSHTIEGHNGDFFSKVIVKGYEDPSDHGEEDLIDIDVGLTP